MVISHKHKFAYPFVTKTATMSIRTLLVDRFAGARSGRLRTPPDGCRGYFTFATCRNPYDRMVSWWYRVIKHLKGDEYGHKRELASAGLGQSLFDFLTLWERKGGFAQHEVADANPGITFIRTENLEEEFNSLPFVGEHVEVPRINATPRPHWGDLLDARSGGHINRVYSEDFALGGYEMLDF